MDKRYNWRDYLTERQDAELRFAQTYVADFQHGTDGHHRLCLIAHLADLLDAANLTDEQYNTIDRFLEDTKE